MFELFSQYTWGQFGGFLLALLVVYYAIVAFIYYRHGFSTAFSRSGKGVVTATIAPAALVRTASAFPSAAVAATTNSLSSPSTDTEQEEEDDEQEQEQEQESAAVVNGSLPDSTAITQQQPTLGEEADEQSEQGERATDEDDEEDDELDQVDAALLETLRQLGVAPPVNDEASAEESDSLRQNDFDTVEAVENQTAQFQLPEYSFEPLTESVASSLDILPVEEQLYTAESVADFIAQIKSGEKPAIPTELLDTSLATQMAELMDESNREMSALFG